MNLLEPQQPALSVGSVMIDIITVIADNDIELLTFRNSSSSFLMLEQGRKVESENIDTYVGGGGANTAVCMRRLGMEMALLALVGKDLNARKILKRLDGENIAPDHIIELDNVGSGIAVHISSHDRNAAIFTHRGANCCLTDENIKAIDFGGYNLVYITNLSNESANHFPLLVSEAAKAGCFIASNPGIRQLTRLSDDFLKSLESITLLSINKVECEALVPKLVSEYQKTPHWMPKGTLEDLPPLLAVGFKFGGFSLGLVDFMKSMSGHGPDYVVITDGSRGAYLLHGDYLYFCPPQKVEMKGSAGAGDGFSSTLACLVSAGNDPDVALFAASINAVAVISCVDTQEGLLTYDALKQKMGQALDGSDISTAVLRWNVE